MLSRYNYLANCRLYDVCSLLSDVELKQTRPAFFKSIYVTLNHIMIGDAYGGLRLRIWMGRFTGKEMSSQGLDAILYDKFEELHPARVLE
ncbi:MAG: DinB family protein, partial [Nostoc sp.]